MIIFYITINKMLVSMIVLYQHLKDQLKIVKMIKVNNNIVLNLLMKHYLNYFNKIKTIILAKNSD